MEIVIDNLSKRYGKKEAIKNLSLKIPSGMYGLLGRNGAGKTSLTQILAALSVPTNGDIWLNGVSITHGSDSPQLAAFYKNAERSEVQANTPQLAAGKFI